MDYERLEPGTVWLANAQWVRSRAGGGGGVDKWPAEGAYNGGKADFDMCWKERAEPCTEPEVMS